jgi:hypothetical protein
VQIYYSDSEFSCDNFDTALAQRSLVEKNPEGFSISISSGGIEGVISINKDNGFEISLEPEELPEVQEIYTAIWLWADENGPSWWQRWWWIAANMGLKFYLYLLGLPISLWAFFSLVAQNNNLIEMRRRAEQLLSAGVTNSNMADVIELLLEMEVRNTASIEILP